ncbi:DUF4238 domain-containing protein [Eubacteriales bacterium OttesenSCG-928-N14]|nr:DUF4238 domain-containing protein [Eubacteriales bacterium OttesenSCG-928-N14]
MKRKRQHYVPQFYLGNFSDERSYVRILTVDGRLIPEASYKSQCYENYFYGQDGIVEAELGMLESQAAPIIHRLVNSENIGIADDEKNRLRQYMLYQYFRTSQFSNFLTERTADTVAEIAKMQFPSLDNKTLKDAASSVISDKEMLTPAKCFSLAKNLCPNILDLDVIVVAFKQHYQLLCSDNPVIMLNMFAKQHLGVGMMGLTMILPISSNRVLIAYDSLLIDRENKTPSYDDVKMLNMLQQYSSNEIVISSPSMDISMLNRLTKQYSALQKMKKKINHVQTLDSPTDKVIMFSNQWIDLDYKFSFLHLNNMARSIPIAYRDSLSRWKTPEWEKRVSIYPIMSQIKAMDNRAYDKMKEIAYKYWESHEARFGHLYPEVLQSNSTSNSSNNGES